MDKVFSIRKYIYIVIRNKGITGILIRNRTFTKERKKLGNLMKNWSYLKFEKLSIIFLFFFVNNKRKKILLRCKLLISHLKITVKIIYAIQDFYYHDSFSRVIYISIRCSPQPLPHRCAIIPCEICVERERDRSTEAPVLEYPCALITRRMNRRAITIVTRTANGIVCK